MPTVVDALGMWNGWLSRDPKLDLAVADAFRMMIYLREPDAQMRWIEREVFSPTGGPLTPYQQRIARWWLEIYEAQQEAAHAERPYFDPDQAAQALRDSAKRSLEAAKAMPGLDETERLFIQAQYELVEIAALALRWHVEAKNNRVPAQVRA